MKNPNTKVLFISCLAFFLLINLIQDDEEQNYISGYTSPRSLAAFKEKNNMMVLDKERVLDICKETNDMLSAAYAKGSKEEPKNWLSSNPFFELSCNQLVLSLQEDDDDRATRLHIDESTTSVEVFERAMENDILLHDNLSNRRMAEKLQKLKTGEKLRILAVGGSMTLGVVDTLNRVDLKNRAWPKKVQQLMDEKWDMNSVEVINIALGGFNEDAWLSTIDLVAGYAPVDIILMESAVNDQGHYHTQEMDAKRVAESSDVLLNLLMRLPGEPAVMSIELFSLSHADEDNANFICPGHVHFVNDPVLDFEQCYYCENMWMPQTWRDDARKKNSVARVSYRDAAWPVKAHPPTNLCQYWNGKKHPEIGAHSLVASTVVFHFLIVLEKQSELLALGRDEKKAITLPTVTLPENICLVPTTAIHAIQGNPFDQMNLPNDGSSCWIFRADALDKYGWICEIAMDGTNFGLNKETTASSRELSHVDDKDYFRLQQEIQLGSDGKLIVTRLVSWVDKMSEAEIWFSTPLEENVFEGDPTWDINGTGKDSIPISWFTNLHKHTFKANTGLSWEAIEEGKATRVIFNIRLKRNSSPSSKKDSQHGIDKFKLLGITTC